jgi:hypothetical protein
MRDNQNMQHPSRSLALAKVGLIPARISNPESSEISPRQRALVYKCDPLNIELIVRTVYSYQLYTKLKLPTKYKTKAK